MRFLFLLILLIAIGAIAIFAMQNNETVTIRYFERSITCPLPLLVAVVYLLGMVSGWTVIRFLSRSLRRVTEHREG
jgi:putative membrane protein